MSTTIIDRGEEPWSKSKHRKAVVAKKEKKKQPMLTAAAARRARAEEVVQVDPLAPCPVNHCNQCQFGKILNSEAAKRDHMKSKHIGCTIECSKSDCGCFYSIASDLKLHKSRH